MNDAALVGVHGLHSNAAARADHLFAQALGQCFQIGLTLVAVTGHIQAQLHVIAAQTVGNQAGQIAQSLHGFAAAADERAHLLAAGHVQNGGFALLHRVEFHTGHAHGGEHLGQIFNGGFYFFVLFGVNVHLDLLVLLGLGSLGRGFGGRFGSGLLLGRGGDSRLCHRGGSRCGCGGGVFHLHGHLCLGRNGAEQLAHGHFQHFHTHISIVLIYAQLGTGCFNGLFNRLSGANFFANHRDSSL